MAELVAVGAGVIAILQITDRVIGLCKSFIESAKDAPSHLRVVLLEISTLRTIFENFNFLNESTGLSSVAGSMSGDDGPIEACRRALTELESLFPPEKFKKRKLMTRLEVLAWPLKENRARKLLEEIMSYKTTIMLAITTESVQDVKDIKKKALDIHNVLTDTQRREVYAWLQHTDPSPIHHRATNNHEPETGAWMLRSPEWVEWLNVKQRCLWIHGIPGAGKTVLLSYLIGRVKEHLENTRIPKGALVYYYCFYGHSQDEAAPFLRWLINQLCRYMDQIPEKAYMLYKKGGEPSLVELLAALQGIIDQFKVIYVVLDAVDESNPREDLLKVLRDLITDPRFHNIQILVSSREYLDIERAMEKLSIAMSMSNQFIEEDIRKYVQSTFQSNYKFRHWSQELLYEVEKSVSTGASGMFRWAVCQLDALQRLKCERSIILKALANLPKTLYETYDRIFLSIPEDECLFVHHVLQWIFYNNELYNGRGIRCSVLLQCVEISTAGIIDSQQDRYYDEETLRELCGCLINIESNVVSSAHYTVREYVDSVLMEKSARTYFKLCRLKIVELVLLQACQSIPRTSSALQDKNQQGTVIADLTDYCMVSALLSLRKWAPAIAQRDSLSALAFSLFDPAKPHLRTLVALVVQLDVNLTLLPHPYPGLGDMVFWGLHWELDTTDTKAAQLVNLLLWDSSKDLVLVHKFLRGITSGNIFERRLVFSYATSRPWGIRLHLNPRTKFDGSVIEFLTSFESFILFSTQKLRQVLRLAAGIFDPSMILLLYLQGHDHGSHCLGKPCLLKQLLDLGADPDGAEFYISPLQIAVFKVDSKAVAILLEAGADLNNTGNKDGFAWKDCSYMGRFNNLYGSSPRFILHHNRHVEGDIYFLGEIDKILNKYRLGKRPT